METKNTLINIRSCLDRLFDDLQIMNRICNSDYSHCELVTKRYLSTLQEC